MNITGQETAGAVTAEETSGLIRHPLWLLLSDEHERDGYGLKPKVWEGPGEYQRVSYGDDDLGYLVKVR